MIYAEYLLFFRESGILVLANQRVPTLLVPNKNTGPLDSNELPWLTISHMCYHNIAGGNKHFLCDHWGKTLRFVPSFHVPFPSADLALYSFVVVNHSCDYDYVLSPVSLLSESSTMGVVPKTMNATQKRA